MWCHRSLPSSVVAGLLAAVAFTAAPTAQPLPLCMETARVTLAGTSNIHPYSVWTDTVRVTQVRLAGVVGPERFWDRIREPGVLQAFEIAIPVATLTSRDRGLDRNMYKALQLDVHREITFRLSRLEPRAGGVTAAGTLRIAGVEREVAVPLELERRDAALVVRGRLPLLMTDYGIRPPTAMLGILKTDPAVTVTFEVVLSRPGT